MCTKQQQNYTHIHVHSVCVCALFVCCVCVGGGGGAYVCLTWDAAKWKGKKQLFFLKASDVLFTVIILFRKVSSPPPPPSPHGMFEKVIYKKKSVEYSDWIVCFYNPTRTSKVHPFLEQSVFQAELFSFRTMCIYDFMQIIMQHTLPFRQLFADFWCWEVVSCQSCAGK